MLHGRTDYDPIQDPRGLIGVDEPVFLLRAKDALMPAVLDFYISLLKTHLNDVPFVEAVEAQKRLTLEWQEKNGKQYPDILPAFYRNQPGPPPTPEGVTDARLEALPTPPQFRQPGPVGAKGWMQDENGVWKRVTPPDAAPAPAPVIVAEAPVSPLDELEIVKTPVVRKSDAFDLPIPPESPAVNLTPLEHAHESGAMKQRPKDESPAKNPLAEGAEKLMMGQPTQHTPGVPAAPPPVKHEAGKEDDGDEATDGDDDRPSLVGE